MYPHLLPQCCPQGSHEAVPSQDDPTWCESSAGRYSSLLARASSVSSSRAPESSRVSDQFGPARPVDQRKLVACPTFATHPPSFKAHAVGSHSAFPRRGNPRTRPRDRPLPRLPRAIAVDGPRHQGAQAGAPRAARCRVARGCAGAPEGGAGCGAVARDERACEFVGLLFLYLRIPLLRRPLLRLPLPPPSLRPVIYPGLIPPPCSPPPSLLPRPPSTGLPWLH
jgi:hypothetical protein